MAKIVYPLEQVLDIKKRRVEEAQRFLQQKQEELKQEEEKLKQCERERDKVLEHKQDKLQQIRDEMEAETTTSAKIDQMKVYLKVVEEKLEAEEKKVEQQKEQVKLAEEQVENARQDLRMKQLEVDKLELHKKDWIKEVKEEIRIEEGREMDEVGNTIYQSRKRAGY